MESVDVLFKLPYFKLFKYILGYLSSLAFFFCFFVSLATFVTYNDFLLQNCGGNTKKLCFNIWHNLKENIISTIDVKMITVKNLV